MLFDSYFTLESKLGWHRLFLTVESMGGIRTLIVMFELLEEMVVGMVSLTNNFSYLFYGTYFLAMLVRSVKNASLFQKFTLNLIGFLVCDLSEPIRCHTSLTVCLIET